MQVQSSHLAMYLLITCLTSHKNGKIFLLRTNFSLTAPLRRWVAEDCEVPADSEKQPTPGLSCQCCRCCSTLFLLFVCPTVANDTLPLMSLSMRCAVRLPLFARNFSCSLSDYCHSTRISLVCPAVICLPAIICDCTVYKVHFPKCSIQFATRR